MNTLVRIYSSVFPKTWEKDNLINRLKATIKVASEDEGKIIEALIGDLSQQETSQINGPLVARVIRAYTKDTAFYPSIVCAQIIEAYYTSQANFVYIEPFPEFSKGLDIMFYGYPIEYDHESKDLLDDMYEGYALNNPLKGEEYLKQYSLEGLKAFYKVWK